MENDVDPVQEPKKPGFLARWLPKLLIAAIIAGAIYGIKLYGDSRYATGKSDAQAANFEAALLTIGRLQDAADQMTRSSQQAANRLDARDHDVRMSTETILQAIKNKPVAQVNQVTGECEPNDTFIDTWNELNSLSSQ